MELLQLQYFRVVARLEHMSKAAQELCITQPSLSKTIIRLEKELGVPLFDRQGRSIRLNRFGSIFLAHSEKIFRELEEGQRRVRDMAGLEQGKIHLVSATLLWIPQLLQHFLQAYPGANFQLSQSSTAQMLQQLETGACDFCFATMPVNKPGIQWRPLSNREILLYVPAGHRLAKRGTIPLREVVQETLVIEKPGIGLRDLIDDLCLKAGVTLNIMCEVDEPAVLLQFVKARLGVAFGPALEQIQINEQSLVALHLTDPICQCTFGIAWNEDHYLSPLANAFRHFVLESFQGRTSGVLRN